MVKQIFEIGLENARLRLADADIPEPAPFNCLLEGCVLYVRIAD